MKGTIIKMKKVKITTIILAIILVTLVAFGGVYIKTQNRMEDKVKEAAMALGDMASSFSESDEEIEVFSPSPCLIEKMAGQWRWHVLLRSQSISRLLNFTRTLLSSFRLPSSLHLEVDVDPITLF